MTTTGSTLMSPTCTSGTPSTFSPSRTRWTVRTPMTMATSGPARRQRRHLERRHEGIEPGEAHVHTRGRVRDPDAPKIASRIDVHPLAVAKILTDPVVFFGIEGCMKADAILSAGGSVFSVPSVSLWGCRELESFVFAYLIREPDQPKTVIIVPDRGLV